MCSAANANLCTGWLERDRFSREHAWSGVLSSLGVPLAAGAAFSGLCQPRPPFLNLQQTYPFICCAEYRCVFMSPLPCDKAENHRRLLQQVLTCEKGRQVLQSLRLPRRWASASCCASSTSCKGLSHAAWRRCRPLLSVSQP